MGEPEIQLRPDHVACARHLEPFAHRWPSGYPLFSVMLFDEWTKSTGKKAERDGRTEMVEDIPAILERSPMCCRVRPGKLLRIYEKTGIGKTLRCECCGERRRGTPYRTSQPDGSVLWTRHLCFRCVIYNMRPNR